MTTTYNSAVVNNPAISHGLAAVRHTAYWSVTITAALAINDVFNFGYLPPNARVHSAVLKCSDMDTNGSPLLTIDVGDAGSAVRFFSASTAGQAGTVDSTMAAAGRFFKTTSKTLITGLAHAAAATGVAGTIELSMDYVIEDSATS